MPKTQKRFKVFGMVWAEEVSVLRNEVGPVVGGQDLLTFDVLKGTMTVLTGSRESSTAEIVDAVKRTGMSATFAGDSSNAGDAPADSGWWTRRGRTAMTTASAFFVALGFIAHLLQANVWTDALGSEGQGGGASIPMLSRFLYSLSIASGIFHVLPKASFALRRARPDMNLLMTIAVIGAVAIGEWLEAAIVAFLFSVSLTLESWSVGRARRAVENLLDLAPRVVRTKQGDEVVEVSPENVLVGTEFIVRPGERIPLDGEVIEGRSDVNQAPITGESLGIPKNPGSVVYAGTVNGAGALVVRSTKASGDTTLAHIIRLLGEAQSQRAPAERWVDRFARIYTPSIMAFALAVLLIPPLVFSQPYQPWIYQALVLLVIACPCALVISTPVSVVAALASAAGNGVLVKAGAYMEVPARLRAVAMDKTGTLTEGRLVVTQVTGLNGHTEAEVLERAAAMEFNSHHPFAEAILLYASELGVRFAPAAELQMIPGKGAEGFIAGRKFWIGSHRLLEERGQETEELHLLLEARAKMGQSLVVVGNNDHVCGYIALADRIRKQSRDAVLAMDRLGVEHIVMLTGDNKGTADSIAIQAGINEIRSELLPEEKVAIVASLVDQYGSVAMIGDGINDAPAMGRATIGIAMGAAGSDTAIEAADIALMSDDLSKVPWLIQHSRRMLGIIRANVAISIGVKAVFVALTLAGAASLWAAIAADMGVSLVVIFNAMRLLRRGTTFRGR